MIKEQKNIICQVFFLFSQESDINPSAEAAAQTVSQNALCDSNHDDNDDELNCCMT